MHWGYNLEAQMPSMCPTALLFLIYRLSVYRTTFQKPIWGVNTASKNFRGLKTQKSPSKVEKCQNILHLTELENVKKCIGVTI